MKNNKYPKNWDDSRVKAVLNHYELQTEDEAVEEDELAWEERTETFIEVPNSLLPRIRQLLAKTAL
ncbi:MAG: hypothetical protein RRC34_16895 [Lentisphaeria bacterium]|nr:hypothetical protein [Lentisphaeria bacterium]